MRGVSRKRILDAARGLWQTQDSDRTWRCFRLKAEHFRPTVTEPSDFHEVLCREIENAKERVYLASLYIGPAADPQKYTKEGALLSALESVRPGVDVKILMDRHRGLRPVPTVDKKTITSAEACRKALRKRDDPSDIYLLSVLPYTWQDVLVPNPYNEIGGVFHVKIYIVDDQLILSGANLSEEYFSDRHDRYLWIQKSELVDCYADLVQVLCDYADHYEGDETPALSGRASRRDLMDTLAKTLTVDAEDDGFEDIDDETETVAYAVPTFQVPPKFYRGQKPIPSETRTFQELMHATEDETSATIVRLASAYLNPTESIRSAWRDAHVHMLTAGRVSHGFKPKAKAGNKGKAWIPTVFDKLAREASTENCKLWFYQRPDWTFHAKGLWLSGRSTAVDESDLRIGGEEELLAVTHGSGNFGARSEYRDMESNLLMVFPPKSPVAAQHVDEWNEMAEYAAPEENEKQEEISPMFQTVLKLRKFRSFF